METPRKGDAIPDFSGGKGSGGERTPHISWALILLERGQPEQKRAENPSCRRRHCSPRTITRAARYIVAAEQMLRCLADPDATPAVDGRLADYFADPNLSATQGNVFYLFRKPRICGSANHPVEAKQWYRQSPGCAAFDLHVPTPFGNYALEGEARRGILQVGAHKYFTE